MARARNIKPGFFTNEILAEVEPLGRILFEGLWCHADREGRLEDRPRKLKVEILPYDDCDVEDLLNQLEWRGFLQRYIVNGVQYIQVVNFKKHQNPHCKEGASTIPAPDEHGASLVIGGDENRTSPADSLNRIPDSLNPKDSPNGESSEPSGSQCPHQEIIALYHEVLPMCPVVRVWNQTRKKYLKQRWAEDPQRQSLDWWRKFFGYIAESKFLTGQAKGREGRPPFVADLEWIVTAGNFAKIVEGKYHREAE